MRVKEIDSRTNADFKRFTMLQKGRGVRKHGLALLSGPKQVMDLLRDRPDTCAGLLLTKDHPLPETGIQGDKTLYYLSAGLFREIDIYGTGRPILLLHAEPFPLWEKRSWPGGCTLFIPFQDPSNVGAVIRAAAAFEVARIVILKEAANPYHHKSTRVSGSTLFKVPIFRGPAIRDLKEEEVPLYMLSPGGDDIGDCRFPDTFGLIAGLEGPGLPGHLEGVNPLRIPTAVNVESLNAAMAAGIALYVWRSRRR